MALVKYNNNSISAITAASSLTTGAMTLIKEQTASASSTISFVDGTSDVVLDNTYPIYLFKFINIHPATRSNFTFNMSSDSGSNYNVTKTTTDIIAYHKEDGGFSYLQYGGNDLAQGTGEVIISDLVNTNNDDNTSGSIFLFNPSSTTFVKHFMGRSSTTRLNNSAEIYMQDTHIAGYGNTTSAVDAVQFKMSSDEIDAGTIKLYGIKDS